MALSDYLTGKNPFEESDGATVATVLRHSEKETAQQTSGSPASVASVAIEKEETPIKQNESVYIKP